MVRTDWDSDGGGDESREDDNGGREETHRLAGEGGEGVKELSGGAVPDRHQAFIRSATQRLNVTRGKLTTNNSHQ